MAKFLVGDKVKQSKHKDIIAWGDKFEAVITDIYENGEVRVIFTEYSVPKTPDFVTDKIPFTYNEDYFTLIEPRSMSVSMFMD